MLVSVIIPCFNQGAYIQECINSVQEQTYTNWEIIIINDGSTDENTNTILSNILDKKIKIINTENNGVSHARNIGINASQGYFILPLDADDKIGENYLQEAVKSFEKNESLKLVYCNAQYFGERNDEMNLPKFSMNGMLFENLIFNAALFKKVDFNKTNGYDPNFKIGWEDWDFWLSFINNEKEVHKLEGVHFFYRIKNSSRNSNLINENRKKCEQQIFKKHINKYLSIEPNPITKLQEFNFYKTEYQKLEKYKVEINKSFSYRLGNFILWPAKKLKALIGGK